MEDRKMGKEDILEMSRQENKNKDLVEESILEKSSEIACVVEIAIGCLLYAAEIIIQGRKNYGLVALCTSYTAIVQIMKAVKMKNKKSMVVGVMSVILTIIVLIAHFRNLIATSTIL